VARRHAAESLYDAGYPIVHQPMTAPDSFRLQGLRNSSIAVAVDVRGVSEL